MVKLQPQRMSWHWKQDMPPGMSVARWVREHYIPADGFHFVDNKEGDVTLHLPHPPEEDSSAN